MTIEEKLSLIAGASGQFPDVEIARYVVVMEHVAELRRHKPEELGLVRYRVTVRTDGMYGRVEAVGPTLDEALDATIAALKADVAKRIDRATESMRRDADGVRALTVALMQLGCGT